MKLLNTDAEYGNARLFWENPRIDIQLRNVKVIDSTYPNVEFIDEASENTKPVEASYHLPTNTLHYGNATVKIPKDRHNKFYTFLNNCERK